jgi:peptide/nickel transport system substrate-binding protein
VSPSENYEEDTLQKPQGARETSVYLRFIVTLLALGMVLAACSSGDTAETTTTAAAGETTTTAAGTDTTEPAEEPQSGGVLMVAVESEPTDLDPSRNTTLPDRNVTINVFNSIIEFDLDDFSLKPGVAKDWYFSDDGLTLTLELEEGVRFHDGSDMTAADVAYTILQNADPENSRTGAALSLVEDAIAVDDYTVEVKLSAPDALIPETLVDVYVRQDGWTFEPDNLIGTGPFKFVRWDRNQVIVLERNDDYWREGLPLLDEIHLVNVADNQTRILRIQAGDVHMVNQPAFTALEQLQNTDGINVVVPANGAGLVYDIRFRVTASPWDNVLVRQALNYAMDRDSYAVALFGIYTAVSNPIATDSPFFAEDAPSYTYDPDRARELLAEAGYPDGLDAGLFENHFELGLDFEVLSQLIQADAAAVGIRMEIQNYDVATWVARYLDRESDYGIGLSNGAGRPTPYDLVNHTWGKGRPAAQGHIDTMPDFLQLLEDTRSLDPASDQFRENLKELQVIALTELPSIVVGNKALPVAVRDGVNDFRAHPNGFLVMERVSLAG